VIILRENYNYSSKNNNIDNIDFNSIFNSFKDSDNLNNSGNANFFDNSSNNNSSDNNASNNNVSGDNTSNDFNIFNFFNNQNDSDSSNPFGNIDIGTIMKMKSIMDKMKSSKNDPRSNLLRSLKPYLKPSRKEQVDKYIQIFNMSQVFEGMNNLGGEKKNDV